MDKQKAKDLVQRESLNAWAKRKCKGTLQLCTGAGKTYAAIRAIEWVFSLNPEANVLIICPTEIIRDDTFPKEFKKWKKTELLKKVDIKCIQTVYKWENKHYDLVVADEIHNYLPEDKDYKGKLYEYHKFFERNTYDRILGLSAWIPDKKIPVARKIAPVAYTLTTDKGVELGVISPYVEYNIPVLMNVMETKAYNKIQQTYFSLEKRLGGPGMAFGNANSLMKAIGAIPAKQRSRDEKIKYQLAIQFWKVMGKRKRMLYEMPSKIKAVRELIDKLKIEKSVIFSQATLFADHICVGRDDIIPYHSKVKDREGTMNKFKDGRTKVTHLSTCLAVNEGMDLPKLPVIIIASRTSGAKAHIQRRGRCLRFQEDKTSYIYNLYVASSQDEKWLRSSQATTDPSRIRWVNNINDILKQRNNETTKDSHNKESRAVHFSTKNI